MAITTRAIIDRLSELERATKNIVQEDERAWKDAEIEKLEQLRRMYFDRYELKDGKYQVRNREP